MGECPYREMGEPRIKSCCIIGSGNVAWHLAQALSAHIDIRQIFSPDPDHAGQLADIIKGSEPISNPSDIADDLDLYLIAVKDNSIVDVIEKTEKTKSGIWVHTSGSVPADVFSGHKYAYGVFYPLQTFSKDKALNLADVGFFIEGNTPDVEKDLFTLASKISRSVHRADSELRRQLHIAAVFACNFVNYMWIEADELLRRSGLDMRVLRPLLDETLRKLDEMSPVQSQTGPARRGDNQTITRHLAMLDGRQRAVYALLSSNIKDIYNNE